MILKGGGNENTNRMSQNKYFSYDFYIPWFSIPSIATQKVVEAMGKESDTYF